MTDQNNIAWTTGERDKRKDIPGLKNTPICSAVSRRTGNPCKAKAMSNGKCYHHGGKTNPEVISKAMMGNENAVKTHAHQRLVHGAFKDDELDYIDNEEKLSPLESAYFNRDVLIVRLLRMQKRYELLQEKYGEDGLKLVTIEEERGTTASKYKRTNTRKEVRSDITGQILALESEMSKVQGQIIKQDNTIAQLEAQNGTPENTTGAEIFISALNNAAKSAWISYRKKEDE
ncbi:hypothetical protein BK126_15410 [Paenibacillus sp. FSL H7-0326]|uniref:hypothetical protein n=1 Tax=Paenibacillus sp. FSL H7-0326 TaxID=1921144 RepID=UPI00096FCACB|nr:hypothetical protein [Paenibacillus sp. FSL H7-0326]OMC69152.1 hypothetical protein BK126_15410 [Paenibacillus sp. FSL H7-0326]